MRNRLYPLATVLLLSLFCVGIIMFVLSYADAWCQWLL
jgi:hypothetical protein